jgi:parallel beta-helix repeat protein
MKISRSKTLTPDRYTRDPHEGPDASLIEIATNGVELDLGGSVLDGVDRSGVGIRVHDCEGVTIRNGVIRGFYQGILAENIRQFRIENCVVSGNHNPIGSGWLGDDVIPVEGGFGGGIRLIGAIDSVLDGNIAHDNLNGIDLVRCRRVTLRGNDASFNSNVGIHLLLSTDNVIENSRADHCIRFTDRFWNDTADSAGILLEEHSHRNRIVGNSLRYGGDGFFIRANNRHASNDNLVAHNDACFSPNNAFEAVFSEGNVFEENIADFSNYGFWLGYSRNTTVRGNRIRSNRSDGVAIEHGSRNVIENNELADNLVGIRLWWAKSDIGDDPSENYAVRNNTITGSRDAAIFYTATKDVRLDGNKLRGNTRDVVTG